MKKYKIDKNIPPTNARENGKYDFPFKDMEVGVSFIVDNHVGKDKRYSSSSEVPSAYRKAKDLGVKIITRKQTAGSIRIWRVE